MGYCRQQCTSMSNSLKKAYSQIVLPYELWLAKHKARCSTPLRKDTNDGNSENEHSHEFCEICREEGNDDTLVVCDDCDLAYHIFCVEPSLSTVPSTEWYCINCLTGASGDYGFEDGGEYSLPEFHTFSDKFKKRWFSKEKPVKNPDMVAEEDCEDEFWRLVDNPHETCQVEYGADLHSNHHGSGFAPIERGPDGVKGDDPWNLNMIPVLPSSLFTHIKTDISGMMVPWLYIGMCFSAFCWHNEDHFTYSINYMHWGETKTWYGVPGEDTTKFEDTMKKAVPELFEQQPNLLFQLVTMLSPGRLLKEKVRVYAVDQRPGEFVVTFPKAYHSGFNHGFNFCEAVNFAPVDWLDYGLECAQRYKDHRRQPCFSHDELLVNIAKMEVPPENVKWIMKAVTDMEQRELGDRKRFKRQHPGIKQLSVTKDANGIHFSNDLDQEHLQCFACHCYTYLSYVTCPCTKKVACFEHFDELCECKDSSKLVHLRFTEDELHSLVEMAGGKGDHPLEWLKRAKARFSDDNLTTEEALQMQLTEAKTEGVSKYYTWEMERTLVSIKEWEAQASALLDDLVKQPQHVRRSRQPKHKKYTPTYCGNRYRDLLDLRKRASAMSLRSPLTTEVETRINATDEFKSQAQHLLNNDNNTTLHDLETMFNHGLNELHTDIEEMELLYLAQKQRRWLDVLEPQVMEQQPLEYEAVTTLVKEAQECQLPLTNDRHLSAVSKAKLGEGWLKMARRLLPAVSGKQAVTMDDLDEVLNVDHDVPILRSVYQELDSFRSKVESWLHLFRRTMMQSEQQQLLHRPSAEDIHNLQDQMRKLPRHMIQHQSAILDLELKHLIDWTTTVKKILRPRHNTKKSFTDILSDMRTPIHRILNQCAPPPLPTPPEGTSSSNKQSGKRQQQQQQQRKRRASAEAPGDVYCICRQPRSGFMLECSLCNESYHGNCINTNSRRQSTSSYVCPMCDPSYNFTPFADRPEFEEFCNVMDEANDLKLVPRTYPALYDILTVLTSYHDRLDEFCRSKQHMDTNDDRVMARKYLRELLGLPISFAGEMELLHKMLHSTPLTDSVAQHPHQQQQHERHHQDHHSCDTYHLDSGSQHNTFYNSPSPATAPAPAPALPSTTAFQSPLPTNVYPALSNDSNAIQHNSSPAHVSPSTPPRYTNSDIAHHHYRKRELSSTVDHPNKRYRQDTPSNGHGRLPMDNLHNSS
ncbi:unnamed protein product [Absidia cylindrospora]